MKSIETLVPDIQQLLKNSLLGKGVQLSVEQQAEIGASLAAKTARALNRGEARVRPDKTLYMSEVGKPCLRQLWYSYYRPEIAEKLLPNAQFKFLYGDYIEELVIFLAKLAGHTVEGEQELCEVSLRRGWVVRGKQDCVIDGTLIDVKSASSYSFKKFKEGLTDFNDAFGYRTQLQLYNSAKMLTGIRPMGWLVVDKQNGNLQYTPMDDLVDPPLAHRMDRVVDAMESPVAPPRTYTLVPDGASGNMKLGVECSYCPFKKECWSHTNGGRGLRAFSYAGRPVFLGTVKREPRVPEIPLTAADSETSVEESVSAGTETV